MRAIEEIRNEITELTERRLALWGDPERDRISEHIELTELTVRVDALWDELRNTRVESLHGDPGDIKRRADRERRMEIELERVSQAA